MSVLKLDSLRCPCSAPVTMAIAHSVNASRAPELESQAREGRLHRARCEGCGRSVRVEKRLLWLDRRRGELLLVLPRQERARFDECAAQIAAQAERLPPTAADPLRTRVLIGLDALRAHLLAGAHHERPPAHSPPYPTHVAQAHLAELARAVRAGEVLDVAAHAFREVLRDHPRGAHLSPGARRDLETLFHHVGARGLEREEARLLEIRFDLRLEQDWVRNEVRTDLPMLWAFLAALPDAHTASNAFLREILLDLDQAGGWYDPLELEIGIGSDELADPVRLGAVLRHEVGHAVHEGRLQHVDEWLTARFGWQTYGTSDPEIDAWVSAMGGYGESSVEERREVRRLLRDVLGKGGRWELGPLPPRSQVALWGRDGFGPRLALEQGGSPWWSEHARWFRTAGKAFFANPWYATLIAVDEAALQLISRMPDAYAAMSHFEFFAELYAMHQDPANPRHRGMPRDVARWLSRELDARGQPLFGLAEQTDPTREPYEEIRRPA